MWKAQGDLIYLRFFSTVLEQTDRTSLRDDVTVVPVGGLDKLATFIALLGGNELELAVLHDYESKPDPRLESLVREKLIRDKHILNYAMFRSIVAKSPTSSKSAKNSVLQSTDVEDLISIDTYLQLFSAAYKKELAGKEIRESDLPTGDRIVNRITHYLDDNSITLRPSGGFNHYRVASYLASHPPAKVDKDTVNRFEHLFKVVNALFTV